MGCDLLERFTVVHERSGYRFMRNAGGRCDGLDVSVAGRSPCLVYLRRPDDCRLFRPGCAGCIEARRPGRP